MTALHRVAGRFNAHLREAFRHDPVLFCVMTAVVIATPAPFWVVDMLPLLDIPQHLATIAVWHHLDDPKFAFDQYFTIDAGSTQYLLYYLTCDVLSNLGGPEVANKVFLSLYAALLPLSVLSFCGAFGRIRAAALLAVPLVFNTFLFYGFVNYVFAFPWLFFGLAWHRRNLDTPSRWGQIRLGLVGVVLFYSHLQVLLIYLGGVGLLTLMAWPGARRFVTSQLHLVPVLVLFAIWLFGSDGLAGGEAWQSTVAERYKSLSGKIGWESYYDSLSKAPSRLLSVYNDERDEKLTVWLLGAILLLLALRRGPRLAWRGAAQTLGPYFPELLTLFVAGFYLYTPEAYNWVWPLNWRFLPLLALLLLCWGRARPGPWLRAGLALLFGAVAVLTIHLHVMRFRAFDREAADVRPILDAIPERARVYMLAFDAGSKVISLPVYLHFVQYHVVRKGGMATYSFAEAPQSPMRFRPPEKGGPPSTSFRSEWRARDFRFDRDGGDYYDYFLVRGGSKWLPRQAKFPKRVVEVAHSGTWTLYHNDRPRPDLR